MNTKRFTLFAIVMAAFVLLVGCKKEMESLKEEQTFSITILKFDSFDEVINHLVDCSNTGIDEDGFVSYAEFMEKEYMDLDPENYFRTKDEMVQYAIEHNDKYQLILGEDGEYTFETRLFNHAFKYVANKDGIFQVKDEFYRIIEGGLIYTSESHLQDLISYVDKGYRKSDDVFSFVEFDNDETTNKNINVVCSNSHNWTKYNGDNKLYFEIDLYTTNSSTSAIVYKHYAKPYHHNFLGWFGCLRTITCSYDNQVVFKNSAGQWPRIQGNQWIPQYPYFWAFNRNDYVTTNKFESVDYQYHEKLSWMWEYQHPNTGGFLFNILDANASTLDVGNIHVYCLSHFDVEP